MKIDMVNYSYAVSIGDSIIQADNISVDNLITIFKNIDELNKKIKESIRKGEVTTLLLSTENEFKSCTIGSSDKVSFIDEKGPGGNFVSTRGYPSLSFYGGNWGFPMSLLKDRIELRVLFQ